MCTIIYNSRVVTYRKMLELDKILETRPTKDAVMNMAQTRILNLLAFDELQSYNDTGQLLFKHPLIAHKSERSMLENLLRTNPQEFLKKHRNVLDNIRRYESYMRKPEKADNKPKYKALLRKYRDKDLLFNSILESIKVDGKKN